MKIVKFYIDDILCVFGIHMQKVGIAKDGGEGSGNFGHSGRPGKIGGSGEGSGTDTDDVFGKSFSEYSGKPEKAIEKLMSEKSGFVPKAITRDGIGDIDFVYGEGGPKGFGLCHIVEKHGSDILKDIPNILRNGEIDERHKKFGRIYIESKNKKTIIRLDWNGTRRNWLATAFIEE